MITRSRFTEVYESRKRECCYDYTQNTIMKRMMYSLLSFIIASVIFGIAIYYFTILPPYYTFKSMTTIYDIKKPNETININTSVFFDCNNDCDEMYNLLFIITNTEPFYVTSQDVYSDTNLVYKNNEYNMNVSYPYGKLAINYFSFDINIVSNHSFLTSPKMIIIGEYNYYAPSMLIILFIIPLLLLLFIIFYNIGNMIRYCYVLRKYASIPTNNATFTL